MIGQYDSTSGAHFAFTDRWGGVSAAPYAALNLGGAVGDEPAAVLENRRLTARALGIAADRVVWMRQVHGRDVAFVDRPFDTPADMSGTVPADGDDGTDASSGDGACRGANEPPPVDGVVTARRGVALAVLTADCTPVLLADPVAGIVGAAHAGRPGLVAGVVPALVEEMARRGAEPGRILARTGPAVCGRCYEVPEQLRKDVAAVVPEAYATTRWGTPAVDLASGVRAQLAARGVTTLEQSSVCTLESSDHFSYRREGTTGRLASYVWLEANDA